MLIHGHVSGAPEDITRHSSLRPQFCWGCPKGFLIQTHQLFPPVTGSYTPNENYKKQLPTLLSTSKQQHQTPCLNTLFSFALRVPLTCHSKTSHNMVPLQAHLLDNTDMHRCNIVLHVDPMEEYTENNVDLSQGVFSSDHNSRKQLEHSSLWEHQ